MFLRIFSIACIFFLTTIAWMILGGTITSRTQSSDQRLASRVQSVWGSPQLQQAPSCNVEYWADNVEEEVVKGVTRKVVRQVLQQVPVVADRSKVDVDLRLDHRKKGLLWYSTYTVAFAGSYEFHNPDKIARTLRLRFALPAEQAIYDGLKFAVNGQVLPLAIVSNGVEATIDTTPGETVRLAVKYKSQGVESWRYSFGEKVNEVRNLALTMTTDFADIDFPDNTLAPGRKTATASGWKLEWNYSSLLSGYQIAMAMPQKLQPGPLAAEISFFAPVSLFFFFFLLFLVTTLRGIDLHPMNYFFLAAAFFAFHLLLAYLVDHIDIHAAFLISSLVSIGLVTSYLRLVAGNQFAFREAAIGQFVYLVLFSYAFFFRGFTGLAITIGAIATLFVAMQATGRIRWSDRFVSPPPPSPVPLGH